MCSPLKCRAADDGHNAPGHSDGATFSDSSEKTQKAQSQIASDKEGMSSRAIHRHSACGEVLKKKKSLTQSRSFCFYSEKSSCSSLNTSLKKPSRLLAFALQLQSTDGDYFTGWGIWSVPSQT